VVPTITWTTTPASAASDWSTAPVCRAYAASDTGFTAPLSGVQLPGTYVTRCAGGVSAKFAPGGYANGTLTVTKVAVSVTAASSTSPYGTTIGSIAWTTSPASVVGDWSTPPACAAYASADTAFRTPLTGVLNVGTYVTRCTGGVSARFTPTSYVNGKLTIAKAAVAVRANSLTIAVGTAIPAIGWTTTPATVPADWSTQPTCRVYARTDTSYRTPLTGVRPAGTYVTRCSGGSSARYTPTSYVNGTLTIA